MKKPLLSICIPTFNREELLKETIDSILCQLLDDLKNVIEIVVSDNASTDNTKALIKGYQEQYNNFVYFRWPENMGPDRNYLKVIEEARGEYCWFFGSDDKLLPGGVRKVLDEINSGVPDIILFDRSVSDASLKADPVVTSWSTLPARFSFHTKYEQEKFIQYIDECTSIGGLFSFLSVIIFKKHRWDAIPLKDRFVGSAYVHVHALFSIMAEGAYFSYIKEPLVLCRLGNDTFCPDQSWDSIYRRLKLDIDGYRQIVLHVFGTDTIISRKLLTLLERLLPMGTLIGIRMYLKVVTGTKHPLDILLLNSGYLRTYMAMNALVRLKKVIRFARQLLRKL